MSDPTYHDRRLISTNAIFLLCITVIYCSILVYDHKKVIYYSLLIIFFHCMYSFFVYNYLQGIKKTNKHRYIFLSYKVLVFLVTVLCITQIAFHKTVLFCALSICILNILNVLNSLIYNHKLKKENNTL